MKRLKKMGGLGKLAAMFSKGGLEGALGGIAPPGALPPGGLRRRRAFPASADSPRSTFHPVSINSQRNNRTH